MIEPIEQRRAFTVLWNEDREYVNVRDETKPWTKVIVEHFDINYPWRYPNVDTELVSQSHNDRWRIAGSLRVGKRAPNPELRSKYYLEPLDAPRPIDSGEVFLYTKQPLSDDPRINNEELLVLIARSAMLGQDAYLSELPYPGWSILISDTPPEPGVGPEDFAPVVAVFADRFLYKEKERSPATSRDVSEAFVADVLAHVARVAPNWNVFLAFHLWQLPQPTE